ncbi:5-oxoprolinase subunit PxpA [Xinfangfangia sp. CPCC 101601]|uniref:5-oxoprolinase subunit PxpA n=1 Tax=Pseudogemmobacter lacusdianii TaxID=3069608 RepID=A0ABU0VZC7_9RHOB|nr:5-oxoprolinase subunit PxpA [Xinfangfangia sp. CPCC 101601]MDQ2066550.1 5-oxoprolinase subunit PxpA [Xinfangfangia sp. CPCC 101601]
MQRIDLNADLGEGIGDDAAMLGLVSSANIACGGHASDPSLMLASLQLAKARGVQIGAHPGYADPANFGRVVVPMEPAVIRAMVAAQIGALQGVARLCGAKVAYVKAHGALANLAADQRPVADAIAETAASAGLGLLAISGTELQAAGEAAGITTTAEIFADRAYLATGRLVPRSHPQAMIHDPKAALTRLISYLDTGLMPVIDGEPIALQAQSICIHGDSPEAVQMARVIRAGLAERGISVASFV